MLGIVIIIMGFILIYVGITGDQHNLMAVITGKTSVVPSGSKINLTPGTSTTSNTTNANNNAYIPNTGSGDTVA